MKFLRRILKKATRNKILFRDGDGIVKKGYLVQYVLLTNTDHKKNKKTDENNPVEFLFCIVEVSENKQTVHKQVIAGDVQIIG